MTTYIVVQMVLGLLSIWGKLRRMANPWMDVPDWAHVISILLNVGLLCWGVWLLAKG